MVRESNHIFSVVSRCNTQQDCDDAVRCVESILEYHPNSDIVLVDSNSAIKSHFDQIKSYGCFIEDVQNINYETGAMWIVYFTKKYTRDVYIFLQDSMTVTGNLSQYFTNDVSIVDYCMGWEYCAESHMQWAREQLECTDFSFLESGFPIVQYNSLIIKRSVLNKLNTKRLNTTKKAQ